MEFENLNNTSKRRDRFNNTIIKIKNKKLLSHKVSFIDQVEPETDIAQIHFAVS